MKEILDRFRAYLDEGPYHPQEDLELETIKKIMEKHLNRKIKITTHAEHKMRDKREWSAPWGSEEGDKYEWEWEENKDSIMSDPNNKTDGRLSNNWKNSGGILTPSTVQHTFSTLVNNERNPMKKDQFFQMIGNQGAVNLFDNNTKISYTFTKVEDKNTLNLKTVLPFINSNQNKNTVSIN